MLDNLKNYRIVLASNSPRRKELLAGLGLEYVTRVLPDVDESFPPELEGGDIPAYIAREKANAYLSQALSIMFLQSTITKAKLTNF